MSYWILVHLNTDIFVQLKCVWPCLKKQSSAASSWKQTQTLLSWYLSRCSFYVQWVYITMYWKMWYRDFILNTLCTVNKDQSATEDVRLNKGPLRKAESRQWKEQTCNIDCTLPSQDVWTADLPGKLTAKTQIPTSPQLNPDHNSQLIQITISTISFSWLAKKKKERKRREKGNKQSYLSRIIPTGQPSPKQKQVNLPLLFFYGLEVVDITVTFTSSQSSAAFWLSFKQTLL